MLPTCSDDFPENSMIKSHTVTILNPESGYLFVLLSISIRVSIHETPSAVSRQATKPFVTLRGSSIMFFAYWRYGSLSSNIHSSLPKRRIFEYKDTNFWSKYTLFNKKTRLWHVIFIRCFAIRMQNAQKSRDINDFLFRYVS